MAILRPGEFQRRAIPVPPSEAEDFRSAEAGKVLLERGHPRFELTTTLLAPVGWRLRVDDLANSFHRQDVAQHARTNEVDAEEAPEAELEGEVDDEVRHTGYDLDDGILRCDGDLQATLILYAQRPGLATVKQDRPNH